MHLLATTATNLDEIVEAVDLGQPPGDIAILSFADSDLTGLAAAWEAERALLPSIRLAHLRDLRHPMSVDLWIDRVGAHAKVIVVRLLGGLDWWKYGIERLSALARERGIALAVLPGEDRDDARLAAASTLPAAELDTLLRYFREGGRENLRALLRRLAGHAGFDLETREPKPVPRHAGYLPGEGAVDLDRLVASLAPGKARRADHLLSRAAARFRHRADRRAVRGARRARPGAGSARRDQLEGQRGGGVSPRRFRAASARHHCHHDGVRGRRRAGEPTPLDACDVPVLQVVSATTQRAAWRDSARGLGAADLAMHIVLPELDGRILAGAIAFKDPLPAQEGLAFTALASRPEPDRVAMVADRIAALVRLRALPRAERTHRRADAGLSRRTGTHRLCGRPRCAGERDRAAR